MIRKICLIAGQNFSGWHRNARIWLTFTLGLVLCLMLSDQMLTRAQTYEAAIQIFEPFIWTFGDTESVLLSTLLLLMLLYSLFIASLMLFLNLTAGSAAGVVGALLINLYGYLLDPDLLQKIFDIPATLLYRANVLCGWLSLLRHATFPLHNFGYDYLPRISVSVMIFLILTAVLLILSGVRMRNYNFTFIQMEE